jgi:hypothetical protein
MATGRQAGAVDMELRLAACQQVTYYGHGLEDLGRYGELQPAMPETLKQKDIMLTQKTGTTGRPPLSCQNILTLTLAAALDGETRFRPGLGSERLLLYSPRRRSNFKVKLL